MTIPFADNEPHNFKPFYNKDARYLGDASKIQHRLNSYIYPIFEEFVTNGYNPREIAQIMIDVIFDVKLDFILDLNTYQNKHHVTKEEK